MELQNIFRVFLDYFPFGGILYPEVREIARFLRKTDRRMVF